MSDPIPPSAMEAAYSLMTTLHGQQWKKEEEACEPQTSAISRAMAAYAAQEVHAENAQLRARVAELEATQRVTFLPPPPMPESIQDLFDYFRKHTADLSFQLHKARNETYTRESARANQAFAMRDALAAKLQIAVEALSDISNDNHPVAGAPMITLARQRARQALAKLGL